MPQEIKTTTTASTTTHPLWNADKAYGLAFFRGQAPCGECDLGVRRGATCGTCDGSGLHPGVERFTLGEHADYVRTELRNALAVVAEPSPAYRTFANRAVVWPFCPTAVRLVPYVPATVPSSRQS